MKAKKKQNRISFSHSEGGVVSVFVVISLVGILSIFWLLSDGAEIRNGRRRLADIATQVARDAAQEIDISQLRISGKLVVHPERAKQRALLAVSKLDANATANVKVLDDRVSLSISKNVELWGNRIVLISASHSARATTKFASLEYQKE